IAPRTYRQSIVPLTRYRRRSPQAVAGSKGNSTRPRPFEPAAMRPRNERGSMRPGPTRSGRRRSVPGERQPGFGGKIDERLAADVDDRLVDGAADERPRGLARVVVRHRLRAFLADVQALARNRELARLRLDPGAAGFRVADVQRER